MTAKELAEKLNGIEYPARGIEDYSQLAKEHGLVIAHGASDDLLEVYGVWREEYSCWEGGTFAFDSTGTPNNKCDSEDCPYYNEKIQQLKHSITAEWCKDGYSWVISASVPFETFDIMEDGDKFCRAIVFDMPF